MAATLTTTPTEVSKLMSANELSAAIAQAIAQALETLTVDEIKAELERISNLLED